MKKILLKNQKSSYCKGKFRTKTMAMLLFFILLSVTATQAQNPNLAWAKAMGSTGNDVSRSVAVDAAGNVYTTGIFVGTTDFDPNAGFANLTSAGSTDIFISKLDASGNLVWAKAIGGISNDNGYGIAVDATGNVYTTGSFAGTVDFDPNAGTTNLASPLSTDVFVSKLDASGNFVWAKAMGSTSNDIGHGIAVDAFANVYTTGVFAGTVDFDPNAGTTNLTSIGGTDIFVSKLDASGNLVWAKAIGGISNDNGYGIAVDATANVYTTGSFTGTVDFDPNAGTNNLTSAGGVDIFVSKLEANGSLVWAKAIGSTGSDIGYGIAVDASGNVYTTGGVTGTADFDPNAGTNNLTSAGGADIFVSKLEVNGNVVWSKAMGSTVNDIGNGIAVDTSGNVYTTETFIGTVDFDPNVGTNNLTSAGSTDIFVSKLEANGNMVWAKAMGSGVADIGYGIAVDVSANVYTTGYFAGTADFDPNAGTTNLTSAGGQDIFVHKMINPPAAALNFDGVNDYVGVTAPTNLPIGNSHYTIEAWIKPSALGVRGIVGWGNWGVGNQCNAFRLTPTGLVNYWWGPDLTVNYAFALNTWYHVACSFDGTTRKIYVNGVVIGSDIPGAHAVTNTNFRIGSTNNAEYFNGGIDEVRIWNRGLPQAEIVNNMNCELAAGQTGLISYYQFNQGFDNSNNSTITTLTDSSVNINTGTLNNFALTGTTSNWVATSGVTTGTVCAAATPLAIFASQTNVSCNGGSNGTASVVVSGGYTPYTYSWSPSGGTAATASGLVAGTYICTITDASTNSTTQNFIISQPSAPVSGTTVVTNVACFGGSNGTIDLTSTGGTAPYTYLWNDGITTEDRYAGLAAGTYSVTITDNNGCTSTISGITVTQPASAVSGTTVVTNVACFGGSNGTIDLTSTGGTAPYTYLWNDGITTEDRYAGLTAGNYSVTITDINGCTETVNVTITQPTSAISETTVVTNVSCFGGSNGTINLTPSGGTGPYTFLWNSGATAEDRTGLAAGTYSVTITDAYSCTRTVSDITITQPTTALSGTATITSVTCNGGNNGAINLTPADGTAPYTFSWIGGITTEDRTGLASGNYFVTITDANGCPSGLNFFVPQPTTLGGTLNRTNVTCFGGNNGTLNLTPTGGTAPYTYLWGDGATTEDRTSLIAGNYSVVVTDLNGCTVTLNQIVSQPAATLSATRVVTNAPCFNSPNGAINVTTSGGTAPYTYNWGGGVITEDRTGLSAGTYSVTITDVRGCTFTLTNIVVTQPDEIVLNSASQVNVSCFGGSNGSITINTLTGGSGGYEYNWLPGNPTGEGTNSVSGLTAGVWNCAITDQNGCFKLLSFTITQPATTVSGTTIVSNVSCYAGDNGTIDLTVSGGAIPYTYIWNDGIITEDRIGIAAGAYSVTITDNNGCTSTVSGITVTQPTAAISGTSVVSNVSCFEDPSGTINLTPTGGTAPYTYFWSDGITTEDRIELSADNYSVTITDFNGCTGTVNVTVTEPTTAVSGTTVVTNVACFGGSNGTVNLTPTGGNAPYTTYLWSDGITTEDRTGLTAGTYYVLITDSNGCTRAVEDITVTEPSAIDATVSQNAGIVTANQSGSTYQWYLCPNTLLVSETNQSFTPLTVGDYKVEIMVAGCMVTSACETVSVLGNASFDSTEFSYYPNPVIDNLNITYNKTISSVQIFDLTGRMVKSVQPKSENISINLTDLSTAMYIAKVTCDDNSQTEIKIFKK